LTNPPTELDQAHHRYRHASGDAPEAAVGKLIDVAPPTDQEFTHHAPSLEPAAVPVTVSAVR
jgi:hypothetical protein